MKTSCEHCGNIYTWSEAIVGKHARCNSCGTDFVVPSLEQMGGDGSSSSKGEESQPRRASPQVPGPPHETKTVGFSVARKFVQLTDLFTRLMGLDGHGEPMPLGLSQVFRLRRFVDFEGALLSREVVPEAPRRVQPWAFGWVAVAAVGLSLMGWLLVSQSSGEPGPLVLAILLSAFAIPVSLAILFYECARGSGLTLVSVVLAAAVGTVMSFVATIVLYNSRTGTEAGELLGAMAAGPIEEYAKIVAVAIFLRSKRFSTPIVGLALGGAVGAGFAAVETVMYALVWPEDPASAFALLRARGVGAIGTHAVWTATLGGVLWIASQSPTKRLLTDRRVVRSFVLVAALHMAWNSPLPSVLWLKELTLSVLAWAAVLAVMRACFVPEAPTVSRTDD